MILFDNKAKIEWKQEDLIKIRMKRKWSSITSKENTKEWIEKILILKKDKKKLTQVSMSNT